MTPSDSQEQGPDAEQKAVHEQTSASQQTQSQGQPSETKPTVPQEQIPILDVMPANVQREEEAYSKAVTQIEESAKQLIGITGALQTLYVAIFAFSDLRKQVQDLNLPFLLRLILLVLYFLPLLLWMASLYFATQIFIVRRIRLYTYNVSAMREVRDRLIRKRGQMLVLFQRALTGLIVSSGLVLIMLGTIVFLLPAPASTSAPTQIIIVTPTPVIKSTSNP